MKTMLLSEAIDIGLKTPTFREDITAFLMRDFDRSEDPSAICGCAGGAALVGAGFTVADLDAKQVTSASYAIAMMLDIPWAIVQDISFQHLSGTVASEIAEQVRREHPDLLVRVAGKAPS